MSIVSSQVGVGNRKRKDQTKNQKKARNILGQMSIAPRYFSMLSSPRETKKFRDEPKKA
jgi:hypothetical protein